MNSLADQSPLMRSLYMLLILFSISCRQQEKKPISLNETKVDSPALATNMDSLRPVRDSVVQWLADRIFKGDTARLWYHIRQQVVDSCNDEPWEITRISWLEESFEGVKALGDINNNGIQDTLFILPAFRWCEDGDSYCFSDTSLPRLFIDNSHCLHLNNVFVLPDIDEDGIRELGTYYSSCTSSYKAILVWRLHNNKWEETGHSNFHILTQDPDKVVFSNLVRKVAKNKFRMKNFYDGKVYWDTTEIGNFKPH